MPRTHDVAASLFALAAALSACARAPESVADYEVRMAVRRYNEALVQAYARSNVDALLGTATPDEARRVDQLMDFLAQGNMVMDARQEAVEWHRVVHESPTHAQLEATQTWWYRHVIPATGEVKQAPRRVQYRNRYHLLKDGDRWLVDRLEEQGFTELPLNAPGRGTP